MKQAGKRMRLLCVGPKATIAITGGLLLLLSNAEICQAQVCVSGGVSAAAARTGGPRATGGPAAAGRGFSSPSASRLNPLGTLLFVNRVMQLDRRNRQTQLRRRVLARQRFLNNQKKSSRTVTKKSSRAVTKKSKSGIRSGKKTRKRKSRRSRAKTRLQKFREKSRTSRTITKRKRETTKSPAPTSSVSLKTAK